MKVRLVAYRPNTSSDTAVSTFQLDLQEEPNIALNFQFSDIKEPETRKGSYSQTFKLPFTKKNHQFFQDWYNVNIDTLVYNTRTKFDATLYVGTVPQFEGSLQLKGVYQKAQVYEVVLMSNSADLFSVIGESKLRDVFRNDDGSYSAELNHTYDEDQFENSWNGSSISFVNAAGASLRDTDVNVQKVMYPMQVTQPEFYWEQGSNQFLDMTQTDIADYGVSDAFPYMVSFLQFRPAIQIKTLFKLILAKASFSYTSSFIDGAYFGKIFMTTGTHLGESTLPTTNTDNQNFAGNLNAGNELTWSYYSSSVFPLDGTPVDPLPAPFKADTSCENNLNQWNTTDMYFTKTHPTQTEIYIRHRITHVGLTLGEMVYDAYIEGWDTDGDGSPIENEVWDTITGIEIGTSNQLYSHTFDISDMPLNYSCRIMLRPRNCSYGGSGNRWLRMGAASAWVCPQTGVDLASLVSVTWDNYSLGIYDATVDVPMCIDPEITQKDFLKDIIQRFNLVILSDPDDSSNLIIEPYNDYLAQSTIKNWTNKLDLSKEIVVRDTTTLQKKYVKFTDHEDVDIVNKAFKEKEPTLNVYGHTPDTIQVTNNQFASGELTNTPIFSPYINQKVYVNEYQGLESYPRNMVVQYELSYDTNEDGQNIPVTNAETKPKLFWYNGTATTVRDASDNALTYNMHYQPVVGQAITAVSFNTYPVCTPYDITPSSDAYTLGPTNKSLYWWNNPPITESDIFNYNSSYGTWEDNTLYGLYWRTYLDNIYNTEARIMECYLNLNEVDIFNFKFNDEIFIKDTYWRILDISNYQVGQLSSTKVKLLKVIDALNNCSDCNYVPGFINGSNIYSNFYFLWCPEGTPNCTPTFPASVYVEPECCECIGGAPGLNFTAEADNGLYPCILAGSLPLVVQDNLSLRSILGRGTLRNMISGELGGLNKPFIRGVDNNKYSRNILPSFGDDMMIKYKSKRKTVPQLQGESHKFVVTGYTEGNTRSYAYPEGSENSKPLLIPTDTNCVIKIKGTATVIKSTNATYVLGTTEVFGYHIGFKNTVDGATQIGLVVLLILE